MCRLMIKLKKYLLATCLLLMLIILHHVYDGRKKRKSIVSVNSYIAPDSSTIDSARSTLHSIQNLTVEKSENPQSSHQVHIVTNYPVMFLPPWSLNQSTININLLKERQEEVEETLQRNLDHSYVNAIHIFVNQDAAERRLNRLKLRNKHKLVIFRFSGMPSYKEFLKYVSNRLQRKMIAITNMDIYLGEGFENLDENLLTMHNVAYVLTRSGKKEKRCDMSKIKGYCETRYRGSHDTYIMKLKEPVSEEILELMGMAMNRGGIDNRFLWVLKRKLKKKLLNPCRYLKTYHIHCSNVHGVKRYHTLPREGKFIKVPPSGLYP